MRDNIETKDLIKHDLKQARWKTRKRRKSRKFFSKIFKSEFSILAVGQNRKLGIISEISDFSKFSICHFFIVQKKIFLNILKYRNSRSQMFFKIDVLKIFAIFTGKHLCWSLFFNKVTGLRL